MTTKRGGRPRVFDIEQIVDLHNSGLNNTQIAKEIGCTPGYISHCLVKRGFWTGQGLGSNPRSNPNAQRVLDYILEKGGSLRNALMALNLKVCDATVRTLAKKQGIDIADYRYFKQRRSNWVVNKPGFRKIDSTHNFLPVQCNECGYEMELHYLNFNNSSPCKCPNCGAG